MFRSGAHRLHRFFRVGSNCADAKSWTLILQAKIRGLYVELEVDVTRSSSRYHANAMALLELTPALRLVGERVMGSS